MLDNLSEEPNENQASVDTLSATENDLQQPEAAEPEQSEVPADQSEADEYFLIDDEEVSVSDVKKWKNGHLMQQDYTRKTQEIADDKKSVKAEKESLSLKANEFSVLIDEFEADLLKDSEGIDWDELWDTQPSEARRKEKDIAEKKQRISEARQKAASAKQEVGDDVVRDERGKLFAAKPEWVKDGKVTEQFTKDSTAIGSYLSSVGYSPEESAGISDHRVLLMALEAAQHKSSKIKAVELEKKVANAPRVSKPRKGSSSLEMQLKAATSELKATGSDQAYMKVQALKKQLKGN